MLTPPASSTFHIVPLSAQTLGPSVALLRQVFPRQGLMHNARMALGLSLQPDAWWARAAFRLVGVRRPRYWVAVERETGRVVGVTGCYECREDWQEALWGGWTCVAPEYRGRHVGRALFNFIFSMAQAEGKQYIRAYTSDAPAERVAQAIYDSYGGGVVRSESSVFSKERRLYRELRLS
jgi:GNAT superfamily N-acetyltransferase